ncbi:hypothetical protein [Streptomyces malaysiensis]
MGFKLNPRREAAIKASQRAETALDKAEKAYKAAKKSGTYAERVAAWDQLKAAEQTAGDARRASQDEYQKARIENGDGPDPLVPFRL